MISRVLVDAGLRSHLPGGRRTERPGLERPPRRGGVRGLRGRRVRRLAAAALRPKWPCSPTWNSTTTATTCTSRTWRGCSGRSSAELPADGLLRLLRRRPAGGALCRRGRLPHVLVRVRAPARLSGARGEPCGTAAALRGLAPRHRKLAAVTSQVPGQHNVLNALACFATLAELGVSAGRDRGRRSAELQRAPCAGSSGRASATGSPWWTTTPIIPPSCGPPCAPLAKGEWSRVIAVFQPHLYSRTEFLHDGVRRGPARGRRGRGHRRLRSARGSHARGERQADRRQHAAAGAASKPVVYLPRLAPVVDYLERPPDRGTWSSPWAPATSTGWASASWSRPLRRHERGPVSVSASLSPDWAPSPACGCWRHAPLAPFTTIGAGGRAVCSSRSATGRPWPRSWPCWKGRRCRG